MLYLNRMKIKIKRILVSVKMTRKTLKQINDLLDFFEVARMKTNLNEGRGQGAKQTFKAKVFHWFCKYNFSKKVDHVKGSTDAFHNQL